MSHSKKLHSTSFLLAMLFAIFSTANIAAQSVATPPKKTPIPVGMRRQLSQLKLDLRHIEMQMDLLAKDQAESSGRLKDAKATKEKCLKELKHAETTEFAIQSVIPTLIKQRVELTVDLAGLAARKKAIEKAIVEAKKSVSQSDLIKKYTQLVLLKKKQLQRQMDLANNNMVPKAAVEEYRIKLLDAEIQLSQAANEIQQKDLKLFNGMMRDIALAEAEKRARMGMVENLLQKYFAASKSAENLTQANRSIDSLQDRIQSLQKSMQEKQLSLINKKNQLKTLQIEIDTQNW